MVGLNRRHYSVVHRAVADAGGFSAVRAVLIDWSEDPVHLRRKGFSDEQITRWVFSNSIHGLDLATYLAGDVAEPRIVATRGDGPLDWYMSLSGQSERGALGRLSLDLGQPGPLAGQSLHPWPALRVCAVRTLRGARDGRGGVA